jgi:hypothetical protein
VSPRKPRFGPRSAAAERLLEDLDHLDPGAVAALAAAGGGVTGTAPDDPDVAAREELRGRLREIARRGGRLDAVRAIGDEVAEWASSTAHWFPAGVAATGDSTKEIGPRMAAVPIVLDAAYAVVLEDLLADWELDLLLAPWELVVGSPLPDRPRARRVEDDDGDLAASLDDLAGGGVPGPDEPGGLLRGDADEGDEPR